MPQLYELSVEHVQGDVLKARTPSGHDIVIDSKREGGGEGPTPLELLLLGVGACSLMDVASILTKKRMAFSGLRATVHADRRDEFPRAFTAFRVTYEAIGDVPQKDLDRACALSVEKYCSVMATVREAPPLSWTALVKGP